MSRELAWSGGVALAFGLGAAAATGHFGLFSGLNLSLAALALAAALALGARRWRTPRGPLARRALGLAGLRIALALVAAIGVERAAALSGLRFEVGTAPAASPALAERLAQPCEPLELLLFGEPGDPRLRRTRLWLEPLARLEPLALRELEIADAPRAADRYGVGRSNTLVLRSRFEPGRFRRLERPGDAALLRALQELCARPEAAILLLQGEGEGDPERSDGAGYSELGAALAAEGYRWRRAYSATLESVPDDVAAVLVIAPERPLHPRGREALERYLGRGGRLVVLLEPERDSGLETLLARWGIETPPAPIFDPPPGSLGVEAGGDELLVRHYQSHPIAEGLHEGRACFLSGVRSFEMRLPRSEDRLEAVAWSGPGATLRGEAASTAGRYLPVAVAGRYPREGGEARIFAVGDADFVSNRHLHSLYNLDLLSNGVHWALGREAEITLRPKLRDTVQFPLPLSSALRGFYGAGLLLPELLAIAGGVVWLRRRSR